MTTEKRPEGPSGSTGPGSTQGPASATRQDVSDGETFDRLHLGTLSGPSAARTSPGSDSTGLRLEAGSTFGAYRLIGVLGKGGFGQVWEAESLDTGRRLALKVLTDARSLQDVDRKRFHREGRLAAAVSHPNCVYVFGAEEVEGHPVITMELVPGGTLQDKLKQTGPMPTRQAVDYVLDVLEGLEAAHASGVLHRDVKPSNCFLGADGRAKVGDFGLSRSLEVDSQLTATGVFMGTPSYASPEQVKAEEPDFRADLYSAGATLYALLTGKPPFEGTQLGQVLARILTEPPPPFEKHGILVPAGLQRAVFRMMAKDREARYPSYPTARAALLPYSSQGMTAASLAKRFGAILVDSTILLPFTLPAMRYSPRMSGAIVLSFLYFLIVEKRWGQSLGKRVFGLQVVAAGGGEMSWRKALIRTGVFSLLSGAPVWVGLLLSSEAFAWYFEKGVSTAVQLAAYGVLLSTMRRRTGYAGVHEVASGTRVVARVESAEVSVPLSEETVGMPAAPTPVHFGPYQGLRPLWEEPKESVWVARDPILHRDVLVHRGGSSPPRMLLTESAPGALQWLQGSTSDEPWEAYEAPPGSSLRDWVKRRKALSWADARAVLATLLPEITRRASSGSECPPLSVDHVWVDGLGRGRLLDFPASAPGAADTFSCGEWRPFLQQALVFMLEGRMVARESLSTAAPRVPLPDDARKLVARLFTPAGADTPEALATELLALSRRPARVNVGRRAAALALVAAWPAMAVLSALVAMMFSKGPIEAASGVGRSFKLLEQVRAEGGDPVRLAAAEACASYYYGRLQALAASKDVGTMEHAFGAGPARQTLDRMSPEEKADFEGARARHPSPTAADVEAAWKALGEKPPPGARFLGAFMFNVFAFPTGVVALIGAFAARGGLSLLIGGIAVRRKDGASPSRWRCLWRGFVALVPLMLPGLWFIARAPKEPFVFVATACFLAAFAGAVYALLRPARGLQDLAAGTVLVPR